MTARVLVCGGRDYADRAFVYGVLDRLHARVGVEVVIHGDARGADTLGRDWAKEHGVPDDPHPAQWDKIEGIALSNLRRNRAGKLYDPYAGFRRNAEMLKARPTHAIAFPGGTGTDDMCQRITCVVRQDHHIEFVDLRRCHIGDLL